jgi:hypothetical protein
VLRKGWQLRTSSYLIFVILAVLGIIAFVLSDRRIAGMYLVGLILLLVADWRYRRYGRTSAKAGRVPTDVERS